MPRLRAVGHTAVRAGERSSPFSVRVGLFFLFWERTAIKAVILAMPIGVKGVCLPCTTSTRYYLWQRTGEEAVYQCESNIKQRGRYRGPYSDYNPRRTRSDWLIQWKRYRAYSSIRLKERASRRQHALLRCDLCRSPLYARTSLYYVPFWFTAAYKWLYCVEATKRFVTERNTPEPRFRGAN